MNEFTLSELSEKHNYVVFDSSVVITKKNQSELRDNIVRDLMECDNLVTISEVAKESRGGSYRKLLRQRVIFTNKFDSFNSVYSYLFPRAQGLIDDTKTIPMTDLKLASLAFVLSHLHPSVALASSDRALNDVVYCTFSEIKRGELRDFPCSINCLEVYSFVQRKGIFVPYGEEKDRHQYSSSRQSGQRSLS